MTTDEQFGVLVFKNEAGDYFLVPQELLERGRVPAERTAEVERLIAASDDTGGYAIQDRFRATVPLLYLAGVSFTWGEYRDAVTFVGQAIEQVQKGLGGPAW
ncbi:MAG: hypothetical protein ACRDJE_04090 [Dehalococcoidia bacterium]